MYTAGYSIQTTTIDNDGLKIREVQSNNKINGKYLYINICSSIIIENPVDKYGKIIKEDNNHLLNVMNDISIPLVVGIIRDVVVDVDNNNNNNSNDNHISKDSLVIDVVFNPIVINLIKNNNIFKTQISELALEWVIKETGLKCDLKWEYCNNGYKYQYGRGDNKDIPVLFFVTLNEKGEPISSDHSGSSSSSRNSKGSSNSDVLSSPSSLLDQITKEKSNNITGTVDDDTTSIHIDILKPPLKASSSKTSSTNSITTTQSSSSNNKNNILAVNKDVKTVESKNKVLIEEIGGSKKQSNDVNVPVVKNSDDNSSITKETSIQSSSSSTLPIPPQSSSSVSSSSSLPQPTTSSSAAAAATTIIKPPSKMEFAHMEQLLGRFDEDYTTPTGQSTLLV